MEVVVSEIKKKDSFCRNHILEIRPMHFLRASETIIQRYKS